MRVDLQGHASPPPIKSGNELNPRVTGRIKWPIGQDMLPF